MKEWKSEDEIKAELRDLTAATRKLRHELSDMMRGHEVKPERRYLHKQQMRAPTVGNERRRRPKKDG